MADPLDPVYGAALSADMARGLALLDAIPVSSLDARQRAAADAMRARFGASEPPISGDLPSLSRALLGAYQRYWRQAMLKRSPIAAAEGELLATLNRFLAAAHPDLDAATDAAKAAIESEGLHALTGMTLPLHELMIWKRNVPTTYHVALPEQDIDVTVVFLDDFVSLGWAAFATAERSHTGGWATAEALYAVRSAYDVDSESFRVSYLAHEGQHCTDNRRFPQLQQPELEYRAKLTELACADATAHGLLQRFAARTGSDRAIPHAFAHHWLVRHMTDALGAAADWSGVPVQRINGAARELLIASSRALEARDAAAVERWLGE
jgi:hypothetical protein